jgi:hypothetical protein
VRYGFRSEKWIKDKHGDEKGQRILDKKKKHGLMIPDPEDADDSLYFCLVDIDLTNLNELKRVTSLEAKGAVSEEMLKAFTEAGGVLDPTKAKGDMSQHAGMSKALTFMKMDAGKETKNVSRKGKGTTATAGSAESKEIKAETPQEKAKNMITKILKDANTCRQDTNKPS